MHPLRDSLEGDSDKILTVNQEFIADLMRQWDEDKNVEAKEMLKKIDSAQKQYKATYEEFKKQFPAYLKSVNLEQLKSRFDYKYRPETIKVIDYLKKLK